MAEVQDRDVLFRAGGATLKRLQALVSAGAGRTEVAHTYTRATVKRAFRDRDGIAKRASAGLLALDWPTGLVDASGNAIGGPLVEGSRSQLVTNPENFGAWSQSGVTRTGGQTDPFGGTAAYLLDSNTPIATDNITQAVSFTGNATKAFRAFLRAGTATQSALNLRDETAGINRLRATATWSAGVPTLGVNAGGGTLFPPVSIGGGWYEIPLAADGIVAANNNVFYIYPDLTGAGGTVFAFGANAWNASFPQSYQAPGETPGVADALTSSCNFGPQSDLTILVRLGRPQHADAGAATVLGVSPGIFSFGAGSAPRIGAYFDPAARNIIGVIDTATTDQTVSAAIPAGNPTVCFQFKNLTTGGQVAIDTGSGLSAFSSAATAFSAFSSQTVRIGRYDDELYGVIGDMVVLRGLFTRAEAMAWP